MTITSIATLNALPAGAVIHHRVTGHYVKYPNGTWRNPESKHPVVAERAFAKSVVNGSLTTCCACG